jgi:hypothetical protein
VPRYFFHLHNRVVATDEEGAELADIDAAREKAEEDAREMVCASVREGYLNLDHRIEVADEAGEVVLVVTFRDAFTLEG